MMGPLHYHDTESSQSVSLGTVYRQDSTGRVWRYAENGGTQADPGKLMVAAVDETDHNNMNWASAPSAGDTSVSVTLGGTAASAGDYKDGWLVSQDGTGEGYAYAVEGHPAASASASLTVELKEEIQEAGAASEANVDLVKSKYKDVVISVTDQADPPVGVFNATVVRYDSDLGTMCCVARRSQCNWRYACYRYWCRRSG